MQLNFKKKGKGQPIILLHGLFGMLDNWVGFAHILSYTHEVYLIDLRNHGRSPHHLEQNYPVMAEDIVAFIQEHQIEKPWIVGHSMGGKVAMQLALTYPLLVKGIVVLDMAPSAYPKGMIKFFDYARQIDLKALNSRKEVEQECRAKSIPQGVGILLQKNIHKGPDNKLEWKFNLDALEQNLSSLALPVESNECFYGSAIFIRGGRSDYIQEKDLLLISNLFPRFQLHSLPKAGHWVHTDDPQGLISILQKVLA